MCADHRAHLEGMPRPAARDHDVGPVRVPVDQEMLVVGVFELRHKGRDDRPTDQPRQSRRDVSVNLVAQRRRRRAVASVGIERDMADDWRELETTADVRRRPAERIGEVRAVPPIEARIAGRATPGA